MSTWVVVFCVSWVFVIYASAASETSIMAAEILITNIMMTANHLPLTRTPVRLNKRCKNYSINNIY